jgi:hypothetical protein
MSSSPTPVRMSANANGNSTFVMVEAPAVSQERRPAGSRPGRLEFFRCWRPASRQAANDDVQEREQLGHRYPRFGMRASGGARL